MRYELTETQDEALGKLLDFIFHSTEKYIILQGKAGTGKTTVLRELINQCNDMSCLLNKDKISFFFTATTHKAVEQLLLNGLSARTVHQFFNIPVMFTNQARPVTLAKNSIVVIDECSYIDYDMLAHIQKSNARCIFVGDKNQLAPVGLNHAPVYYMDLEQVELTEVIRQKNAPDILAMCNQITDNLATKHTIKPSNNIIYLDEQEFLDRVKQLYPYDGTKKVLALKNETIKKFNNHIDDGLTINDVLVSNCSTHYLRNNQQVTIYDISPEEKFQGIKGHWIKLYELSNSLFVPTGVRGYSKAKSLYNSKNMSLHDFNQFADLRKPYAQTIHKAQGSTYKEVYVYLPDLKTLKDREEINRLLYVALSRATDKVYLTGECV